MWLDSYSCDSFVCLFVLRCDLSGIGCLFEKIGCIKDLLVRFHYVELDFVFPILFCVRLLTWLQTVLVYFQN